MTTTTASPELGRMVRAGGIDTNVLEAGQGDPVVLLHGSGPGVTAYANWRLTLPALAERLRCIAPDLVGFGYTRRPARIEYNVDTWAGQVLDLLDALDLDQASVIGNSFGGAIALRLATRYPDRVNRLVLMGSVGVAFELTEGLDAVWGYQPSPKNMRRIMDYFAYSRELVTDELAGVRYRASIQPGFQEAFAAMFPAPRQRWVEAMRTPEEQIAALPHRTLLIHGREDRVIPLQTSLRLLQLIDRAELHVFGRCGHWTQIEHAARFARLVGDFLTDYAGSG